MLFDDVPSPEGATLLIHLFLVSTETQLTKALNVVSRIRCLVMLQADILFDAESGLITQQESLFTEPLTMRSGRRSDDCLNDLTLTENLDVKCVRC